MPYYEGTREQEIVDDMIEGFNPSNIKVAHSLKELSKFIQ